MILFSMSVLNENYVIEKAIIERGEEGPRAEGGAGGAVPISKLRNNTRQSLGMQWSMSEVGTPPLHNSNKPHGLVASNNNIRGAILAWDTATPTRWWPTS